MRKQKIAIEDFLFTVPSQICNRESGNSRLETNKGLMIKEKRVLFNKIPYSVSETNKYEVEDTQDRTGAVYCI